MPKVFALSSERLAWPEQARAQLTTTGTLNLLQRGLLNQRLGNLSEAESCLLAALNTQTAENLQSVSHRS